MELLVIILIIIIIIIIIIVIIKSKDIQSFYSIPITEKVLQNNIKRDVWL